MSFLINPQLLGQFIGAGALASEPATISGAGAHKSMGTGALAAGVSTISGVGGHADFKAGAGALVSGPAVIAGVGTGGSFLPTDLPDLELWLDANDINTLFVDDAKVTPVASDADYVGCWVDKSTNAYEFTQDVEGTKPRYKTNIQNSKPVVRGDGFEELSNGTVANWKFLTDGTGCTIIVVYRTVTPIGSSMALLGNATGSPGIAILATSSPDHANAIYWLNDSGTVAYLAADADDYPENTWTIGQYDIEYGLGGDDITFFNLGTSVASGETTGVPSTSNPADEFQIFGWGADSSRLDGDIAEVIICSSILSSGDRSDVTTYLSDKWGIT